MLDYIDMLQSEAKRGVWKAPAEKKTTKPKSHPERDIQDEISKYLLSQGFLVIHVNSGVMTARGDMPFKAYTIRNTGSNSGYPDLTAMKNGKVLLIEVKTKTGTLSDSQKRFQQLCKEKKLHYIVARSVDDIKLFLGGN